MELVNSIKEKVSKAGNAVKEKLVVVKDWAVNHPYEAIAVVCTIAGGTRKVVRSAQRHEEKLHRERDFYDPRVGRYTRARRTPKNWELDQIEFRYRNGESYNEILRDMNLRK